MALNGVVATIEIRISSPDDGRILSNLEERRAALRETLGTMVQAELGTGFGTDVMVSRGSVLLSVIITAANAVIFYDEFLNGVERLKATFRGFFIGDLHLAPDMISSNSHLGLVHAAPISPASYQGSSGDDMSRTLLAYLILSHAALLAFLLWVAVRRQL